MDESLYSDSVKLQGSIPGGSNGSGSTRLGSTAGHMNARNLFDESLDLDGAGTQDTDIPEEQANVRHGYSDAEIAYGRAGPPRNNGEEPRLPSSELGRLQLHEPAYATTSAAGSTSSSINGTEEATHSPTGQGNNNDDLPTVPPLSAEERRQQALTRERDDLAKMNTLLEHAIASISRTVPKMESFQQTMGKTHDLLDTYTKVLSQAEHTQNLLLDGSWEPQRDEDEIREAAEAEERRMLEEEERLAREQQEAEEKAARLRAEAERKASASTGRGRGVPSRGTRGVPGSRLRGSVSQRGSSIRGTSRGRGSSARGGST